MIKNKVFLLACLLVLNSLPVESWAKALGTVARSGIFQQQTVNGSASQRKELTVRQLSPISFGAFASTGNGSGSITISPLGMRTISGNVAMLNGNEPQAAEFEILGQPDQEITLFLPERVTLSKISGGSSMTSSGLTVSPSQPVKLDAAGRVRIKVGGTLRVSGFTQAGPYNGYFDINAQYTY